MRAEDIPFLKPRRPLMGALTVLWIPILLSAVIVFVASSIIHMVLPYHRSDYKKLPDEDKVTAALRSAGVTRGMYVFPYCTHKEMKSPEILEKQKQGPVGAMRSEEHTSELQSRGHLVCRLLLEKKKGREQWPRSRASRT